MRFQVAAALVLTGVVFGAVAPLRGQSLGAVASQEEERRKTLKNTKGKIYSNKDLSGVPPVPIASASETPPPASSAPAVKDDKERSSTSGQASADGSKDLSKDESYWASKLKQLRAQLDRDQTYAEALQNRVSALTTDFVNRDDPAKRAQVGTDRQKAMTELDRLKKQIEDDKKAIADVQDQGRRAGVPAGWLR
jgi:hypothetical protein